MLYLLSNPLLKDYFPLFISNLLVVLFFLFFQNNKKKTDTVYQNQIARLEAHSLCAQMNPHFIYNALNSLQSMMLLKGERETNRYIGTLSKLLRFTLEMSSKESITFREEIEYLEAYLCFQQMRLGSKLNYKIDMENSFKSSAQEYLIPPMLIQPLIENAIIHGIGPLKDKTGCVTLQINKSADYLNVKVTDNGIGLYASKKLKENKPKIHKSYATQILRERIDIFNYLKKKNIRFTLKTMELDNKITGTVAQIEIPILQPL
jgi:sensor histidine kinase YesM